jgi:hypothetical protein
MNVAIPPAPYTEWRERSFDREEDAAYAFGHDLIVHCRDEAMASIPDDAAEATRGAVEKAVDVAPNNVMDLLEGFWPLPSGESHFLEYVLQVRVRSRDERVTEALEIAPCKLDLPIGYWKWARDREFRNTDQ